MGNTAVIVVNYASTTLVAETLGALAAARPDLLVVLVDSFSTIEERRRAEALAGSRSWTFVATERNVGFGVGVNLGAESAARQGAERLLLLNPDATIDAESVAVLESAVTDDPLTLAAPRILRPDGSVWSAGSDVYLADGRIRSSLQRSRFAGAERRAWLTGACVMIDRTLWDRIGGFRDDYFLYWEDVDLSWRVEEAGGRLALCESATAVHAEGGTQGEGRSTSGERKSDVYYFYNIRNRLVFAALNLEGAPLRAWNRPLLSARIAYEVLLQGGRRQLVEHPGLVLLAWRAVREGRASIRRRARPA